MFATRQHVLVVAGALALAACQSAATSLPPGHTGRLYVSNHVGDRIDVFEADGTYSHNFTAPGLNGPRGIVIHPITRQIYVAGELGATTKGVYVFDAAEQFIMHFNHASLDSPTGMALSPDLSLLYVASFNMNQIAVFTLTGAFVRTFSGGGLIGPNCVAFDSAGYIYVASAITDEVIKFTPDERYLESFSWGPSPNSAMGIARSVDDVMYVAAGSNPDDIFKFSPSGELLDTITHNDLSSPQGIAIDDRGHLFSSSFYQHNIVEFDAAGNYVQTIHGAAYGIGQPRSLAFMPLSMADLNEDGSVNAADLALLLALWGPCPGPPLCPADFNLDGTVGAADLATLLGQWSTQ